MISIPLHFGLINFYIYACCHLCPTKINLLHLRSGAAFLKDQVGGTLQAPGVHVGPAPGLF